MKAGAGAGRGWSLYARLGRNPACAPEGHRDDVAGVDPGDGQVVALGQVDEHDPHALRRWLEPLVKQLGVQVIVTDDLATYRAVSEQLGLGHQVCQFHVRRWVGKSLRHFRQTVSPDWSWVLDEVEQLIEFLPPEGDKHLRALWRRVDVRRTDNCQSLTPPDQLRSLLMRLSEH